ncbi:RidA family protein [Paraburkholderia mimosarum]|uniref:RidA family protein n=1 Tax=Paraburkholderia mimosarum TaxID=312026 RepID=UPI000411DE15|nr:RidA family protein [Paraburkholderia mimosarum]
MTAHRIEQIVLRAIKPFTAREPDFQGEKFMIIRQGNTGRLSRVLVANGFAFLSGVTARDTTRGVREQTEDILAQVDSYLKAAGADKSRIAVANIWLRDIDTFDEMNNAWDAWVDKECPPARATVESHLAGEDILVEIQVQAAV